MEIRGAMTVVTGAATGAGLAIAVRLAAEGARVAVADIDERQSSVTVRLIREAGGEAAPIPVDVISHASVVAMLAAAEAALGDSGSSSTTRAVPSGRPSPTRRSRRSTAAST